MRKNRDKEILEALFDGEKNIYEIFKYIKSKFPNATYPPILRMVKKLEEKGLIEENPNRYGIRKAKFYNITVRGLVHLYIVQRGKEDALKFHRSEKAKKIIKEIIEKFSQDKEFNDQQKDIFSRVAYASPSFIYYLAEVENEQFALLLLKETKYFEKLVKNLALLLQKLLCINVIEYDSIFLQRFYTEVLPQIALARDLAKYKDKEIGFLLFEILFKECERIGKTINKLEKSIFETVLSAVKKGIIDPTQPAEEQYLKYIEYVRERQINCPQHWKLYIPPIGKPVLACEGCPQRFKRDFFAT